ncbi:aminotransferase class I/II-fold pyridoxal phosphate-dependent enzyme [Lentibacillus sp. Marseille-P4043]|uniref:aminotransferase class I/II-fold pyridoxal phosphate-dependent enzyme n=1 Tax=Lentibacillus sp. Marseille-P4043 TaxID=2040293 RepID=UPI000D0AC4A6|nr:aminotransferase class I/II-fold pyridoxal phosphate-dependent enzyme [Lentibacillus sp. Marseille-P4043]
MKRDQQHVPLYQKLTKFSETKPISFHVPGHKNGAVFPSYAKQSFAGLLSLDLTELTGLDDLHAPHGVIAEAEELAADFFGADHTFFLVGGSTAGNIAMILVACSAGEEIIVQRNSHKSIINGLELGGANPVFITPEYDQSVGRYTSPSIATLERALQQHSDAKAVVLTYPDYFGKTYNLKKMIELAHDYHIPVLVDEAHGVHFSLGAPFPLSALEMGADIVVQSAHKMAPAMTMSSYLHMNTERIAKERVAHYLQMLQSSSPSYPLMASLDIARSFLATITSVQIKAVKDSVNQVRGIFKSAKMWSLLPVAESDDFLKLTLHMKQGISGYEVACKFEQAGVYPELATHNQVLFIHGLQPFQQIEQLKKVVKSVDEQLKICESRATIDITNLFPQKVQMLELTYQLMNQLETKVLSFYKAVGNVAAEAIIPYPPGIPLILQGERITSEHILIIEQLIKQGVTIQHRDITNGIRVFNR